MGCENLHFVQFSFGRSVGRDRMVGLSGWRLALSPRRRRATRVSVVCESATEVEDRMSRRRSPSSRRFPLREIGKTRSKDLRMVIPFCDGGIARTRVIRCAFTCLPPEDRTTANAFGGPLFLGCKNPTPRPSRAPWATFSE